MKAYTQCKVVSAPTEEVLDRIGGTTETTYRGHTLRLATGAMGKPVVLVVDPESPRKDGVVGVYVNVAAAKRAVNLRRKKQGAPSVKEEDSLAESKRVLEEGATALQHAFDGAAAIKLLA